MGKGSERNRAGKRGNENCCFLSRKTHFVYGGAQKDSSVSTGPVGEAEGGEKGSLAYR